MTDAIPRSASAADTEPRDERARGRELALLALCHLESYPRAEHAQALELLWQSPPRGETERGALLLFELVGEEPSRRRAAALVHGLMERWAEIDGTISETSARWRLDRMAQVDRNVLRLAAFELAARPQTPRPVVLAEAVRLARRYGSEHSAGFVNGVADALARRLRPDATKAPRTPEASELDRAARPSGPEEPGSAPSASTRPATDAREEAPEEAQEEAQEDG